MISNLELILFFVLVFLLMAWNVFASCYETISLLCTNTLLYSNAYQYSMEITATGRVVFRNHSNIYGGAFLWK